MFTLPQISIVQPSISPLDMEGQAPDKPNSNFLLSFWHGLKINKFLIHQRVNVGGEGVGVDNHERTDSI